MGRAFLVYTAQGQFLTKASAILGQHFKRRHHYSGGVSSNEHVNEFLKALLGGLPSNHHFTEHFADVVMVRAPAQLTWDFLLPSRQAHGSNSMSMPTSSKAKQQKATHLANYHITDSCVHVHQHLGNLSWDCHRELSVRGLKPIKPNEFQTSTHPVVH